VLSDKIVKGRPPSQSRSQANLHTPYVRCEVRKKLIYDFDYAGYLLPYLTRTVAR
jgi:hypothetical protein